MWVGVCFLSVAPGAEMGSAIGTGRRVGKKGLP
jgi:hypothetical protein